MTEPESDPPAQLAEMLIKRIGGSQDDVIPPEKPINEMTPDQQRIMRNAIKQLVKYLIDYPTMHPVWKSLSEDLWCAAIENLRDKGWLRTNYHPGAERVKDLTYSWLGLIKGRWQVFAGPFPAPV